jgi:hypothetical protein
VGSPAPRVSVNEGVGASEDAAQRDVADGVGDEGRKAPGGIRNDYARPISGGLKGVEVPGRKVALTGVSDVSTQLGVRVRSAACAAAPDAEHPIAVASPTAASSNLLLIGRSFQSNRGALCGVA